MTMGPAQAQSSATQPAVSGDSLAALLKFGGLASLAVGGWIVADRLILSQRQAYRFSPKMVQSAQRADSDSFDLAQGSQSGVQPRSAIVVAPEAAAPELSEEPDISAAVRSLRARLFARSAKPPQAAKRVPIPERPFVPGFNTGQNTAQAANPNASTNAASTDSGVAASGQSSSGQGGSSRPQDSTLAQGSRSGGGSSAVGLVPSRGAVKQKKLPAPPDLSALIAAPPAGGLPGATTASAFDVPSAPALPAGSIVAAIPSSGTPEGSTDYLTISARRWGVEQNPTAPVPVNTFQEGAVAAQPGDVGLPDLSVAGPDDSEGSIPDGGGLPLDILPSTPALQAAASAKNIFVDQFTVTGSSIFSQEELALAARKAIDPDATDDSPVIGRELSPAELVRAGEAITQLYVDQGYLNSGAYVPEDILALQTDDGKPREIVVVEGSLEDINVEMESPRETFGLLRGLQPGYVKHRLEQVASKPLNVNELLEAVQLLERDPVIEKISTELVPGTETGTSILNVTAQPSQDLNISLSTDNYRSPSVGSVQQRLSLSQANVFGFGDFVTFGYGRSEGTQSIDVGFSAPLNSSNGTLTANFNQSNSTVLEFPFSELDIESKSRTYELGFRQPIKRTLDEEIALSLKATRRNSEGFFLDGATPFPSRGADLEGRTKISALRFGQDWIRRQPKQFFSVSSQFNLGLGLFGATVNPEPPDSRFFYWRGRGQWVRQLGKDSDSLFLLKGDVQLATNPLVPSEQFGLGGPATIRGYRQNSLLTDSGFLGSAEVQFPLLRLPKLSTKLKLAPFFEFGKGWNVGEGSTNPEPNGLASTGVGLLLEVADDFNARVDWGFPLTNLDNGGDSLHDSGVTFSVFWKAF